MTDQTPQSLLEHFLDAKKSHREQKPATMLRLSASGGCTRKAIFTKLDPTPEDIDARAQSIFELGDAIHAMERGDLLAAGIELSNVEATVELHVPAGRILSSDPDDTREVEGFTVKGHIDGIVHWGKARVLDVKSMGENSFKRALREGISEEYSAQLNSYLHATGLDEGLLWCYAKNTSERMILTHRYDPQLQEQVFAHFRTVYHYQEGDPLPPPSYMPYDQVRNRRPTGLSVLYFKCGYCRFRERCWPDYVQDATSDKPKFIFDTQAAELADVIATL